MARITRIYTRTGDDGSTGLASGERVPKDAPRVVAYGEVDELNSLLGVVIGSGPTPTTRALLLRVQNKLFDVGADLCYSPDAPHRSHRIGADDVAALERNIDAVMEGLPPLENFILPGGSLPAAHLHVARTVCRRAERAVVTLAREDPSALVTMRYLNRLSDLLFALARAENVAQGAAETYWTTTR